MTGLKSDALGRSALWVRLRWARLSLFKQFALTAAVVLTFSMAAVGAWVSSRIADGVLRGSSGAAALYVTSFLEPHVQTLETGVLTPDQVRSLNSIGESFAMSRHVLSIKIWRPDGVIIWSTQTPLIGKKFATTAIEASLNGAIRAGMAEFDDNDSDYERHLTMPLYEVFTPIYKLDTGKIIGVVEFYEDASALLREQSNAIRETWLVVGSAGVTMLILLFSIVYRGDVVIKRQKEALKHRLREQLRLGRSNDVLQSKVQEALRTSARVDDLIHTRIGSELHDGPAQLIASILLRLDDLEDDPQICRTESLALIRTMRTAAAEALAELRAISVGLFLPDPADTGDAANVVQAIVWAHERRTKSQVVYEHERLPGRLPREIIRCVGRVTQEALTNSYKHANAAEQKVHLRSQDDTLFLTIEDAGPGFSETKGDQSSEGTSSGLGMRGMRSRVEALGGVFEVRSKAEGTQIACRIPIFV